MEERLRRMLDSLDEQQTTLLLDNEIQHDMDQETLDRIRSSVRKKAGMKKKNSVFSMKLIAGAAAVLLGFFTVFSLGSSDIVSTIQRAVEFIPGYGIGEFSHGGNTDKIPQEVLDMVENRRVMHSLTKEKLTIGEKGYGVNYINELKLKENAKTLKDLMKKEEHWQYIIENKGESYLSMLVGKHQGKYDVLMYGDDAEMFYHTLSLADPSNTGKVELLAYGGENYIIDQEYQVYQIPRTRTDYERNPEIFDSPISEKICIDLILENYSKYISDDKIDIEFGSIGLVEQYHDKNDQ